jgi:hypothetical protein
MAAVATVAVKTAPTMTPAMNTAPMMIVMVAVTGVHLRRFAYPRILLLHRPRGDSAGSGTSKALRAGAPQGGCGARRVWRKAGAAHATLTALVTFSPDSSWQGQWVSGRQHAWD